MEDKINKMFKDSKRGSEEDARREYEPLTLIEAVQCNNDARYFPTINELFNEDTSKINDPGDTGYTPLHWAVMKGHVNAVKYLYEHNADPTIVGNNGYTPFQQAAYNGHLEMLKYFVEEVAPPITSPINQSAYASVMSQGGGTYSQDVVTYLGEHNLLEQQPALGEPASAPAENED
jgi:ankyrin repeat protein